MSGSVSGRWPSRAAVRAAALWVVLLAGAHAARANCPIRTDYEPAVGCNGTFQAATPADLATYVSSNFGRSGNNYKNLKITANLTSQTALDIESPCTITLSAGIALSAPFVRLDGRKGTADDNGYTVQGAEVCLLSAEGDAGIGSGGSITADSLTVQAAKTAKLGQNTTLQVPGALSMLSTGDFSSSTAEVRSGAHVTAGSLRLQAPRAVFLGQDSVVEAGAITLLSTADVGASAAEVRSGAHVTATSLSLSSTRTVFLGENTLVNADTVSLVSTGDAPASDALIKSGARVNASSLTLSASRGTRLGDGAILHVTGDVSVRSTGSDSGSDLSVASSVELRAGRNAVLQSGNTLTLGLTTSLIAVGELAVEAQSAAKCTVRTSAFFAASSFTGNCIPDITVQGVAVASGVARLGAALGSPLAITGNYAGNRGAAALTFTYQGQSQSQNSSGGNFTFNTTPTAEAPVKIAVVYPGAPAPPPEIRFDIRSAGAPTIGASLSPPPNAAGWNNTPVTVTFACTNVQSCPAPVLVDTETSGQTVTGTATDAQGHPLSASVTVRLDRTAPVITAASEPAPNAAGWNRTDVDVSFVALDALSGIAGVSPPVAVTAETMEQEVQGTATDVAGNSATAAVIVKLDRTPPQIAFTTPTDGSLTKQAAVEVSGTATDANPIPTFTLAGGPVALSGSAFSQSVALVLGDNTLLASATDIAGNSASASLAARRVVCFAGETQTCFDGPSGSAGVGVCVAGSQVCADGGLAFATCNGQVLPGTEVCNQLDDDCDGQTDDQVQCGNPTCVAGVDCTTNQPGICAAGRVNCPSGEFGAAVCTPLQGPHVELCDELDNDCDGEVDEGFNVGDACATDQSGICAAGVKTCAATGEVACLAVNLPQPEVCDDGIDQNCDGRDCHPLAVHIESPSFNLITKDPQITVTGSLGIGVTSVTVNGVSANRTTSSFSVSVPLEPGENPIVAIVSDANGNSGTVSTVVTRDILAPRVTIDSPPNGTRSIVERIAVTGTINDMISGGVPARVEVNGVQALVDGDSFTASGIPLVRGPNQLRAIATDSVGNQSSFQIEITLDPPAGSRLEADSGDMQSARVGELLPQPLVARLLDAAGNPLASRVVDFEVVQNDGTLVADGEVNRHVQVVTDGAGRAIAFLQLGERAGAGSNRVVARSQGASGESFFHATGVSREPAKIVAGLGENQTGLAGAPLSEPLEVLVLDEMSNPVTGVPVVFSVQKGGGNFNGDPTQTVTTRSDGLARAMLTLGPAEGISNNVVTADFSGNLGLPATFSSSAAIAGPAAETRLVGIVLDNSNTPIPGARVEIGGTDREVITNDQGQFTLESVPVGPVELIVDPISSPRPEVFPALAFRTVAIAGHLNRLSTGPIRIPALVSEAEMVGGSQDVVLTMPGVAGFTLTVFANSTRFPDGSRTGLMSINQVQLDKVPMVPPGSGVFAPVSWTVQPPGVVFDPPARLTIPNNGLRPGHVVDLFQFDHDRNRFIGVGPGSVSEDGLLIASRPGFGVTKSGWGGVGLLLAPLTCGSGCNDGDVCNGTAACVFGFCVPISNPIVCTTGTSDPCVHTRCDPKKGCVSDNGQDFSPDYWNDVGRNDSVDKRQVDSIQFNTNCYAYAAGVPVSLAKPGFEPNQATPGLGGGAPLNTDGPYGCAEFVNAMKADRFQPGSCDRSCPNGQHKVAAAVSDFIPSIGTNAFHIYRQHANGTWSNKHGGQMVTDKDEAGHKITDPRTARDIYSNFCGCFCSDCKERVK